MPKTPSPRPRPRARYSEAIAARVCARLAAGESQAAISRDPTMPAHATIALWRRRHPEFDARYVAAQSEAGGPCVGGRPTDYSPELGAAICAQVMEGAVLYRLCRQPGMPGERTVYRWLHERPDFLESYLEAREICAHRRFDQVWEIATEATPETVQVARLRIEAIKWLVGKMAPKVYGQSGAAARVGGLTVVIRRFGEGPAPEIPNDPERPRLLSG